MTTFTLKNSMMFMMIRKYMILWKIFSPRDWRKLTLPTRKMIHLINEVRIRLNGMK